MQLDLFGVRIEVPTPDLHDATTLIGAWYALDPELQLSEASPVPWLWLGAQEPYWTWEGHAKGPLLLAAMRFEERWPKRTRRRGRDRNDPLPATVPVYLDSSAFSVVSDHGSWDVWPTPRFVEFIERACRALGTVQHVGCQDWMCEPEVLRKTGLDVREHQRRTVDNFLELRDRSPATPWVPTLQGYTLDDYLRCADMFEAAGVALADQRLVGLGSVCRRSGTDELAAILEGITARAPAVDFHGYGVKSQGAFRAAWRLRSIDTDAWSKRARGAEVDLRKALGLPANYPSTALMALDPAQLDVVDLEMRDFWLWKRETCPTTASVSQAWAEFWRARQCLALAYAVAAGEAPEDDE